MPLDTSLIQTDLPAIITALSKKGPRFVKHGPDRAAQLCRRSPAPWTASPARSNGKLNRCASPR